MSCELTLTPAGRLRLQQGDDNIGATPDAWMKRAALVKSPIQSVVGAAVSRYRETRLSFLCGFSDMTHTGILAIGQPALKTSGVVFFQ